MTWGFLKTGLRGAHKVAKELTLNLMEDWSESITVSELTKIRARIGA
jgi:hypothetical protein